MSMPVLIVTQKEVPRLLPMKECIEVMHSVLSELARGETLLPLRTILWLPERVGALGLMPGALLPAKRVGVKAITFFHGNEGTELDTHQGTVLLFEAEHGRLLAVIDATSITAIRTAAVSGVATRLLAREDAGDLALVGSGVQARTHLEAMLAVRPIRRVRVASKDLARARRFADRESKRLRIEIEPMETIDPPVPWAIKCGMAALAVCHTPVRFTSMRSCQSPSATSCARSPKIQMAAFALTMSTWPSWATPSSSAFFSAS